jgi:hypothetical protein
MLEGGDRTVDIGKGGVKMCQDLGRRPQRGLRRQRRWRAACRQRGADPALAVVKSFPDALPGAVSEVAVCSADGLGNATGGGALEEPPQRAGGEAESSDFVGAPDAEGTAATRACIAVAAKDAAGAQCSPRVALVKAAQKAVANERADHLAMWTRHQLEPLSDGDPFVIAATKPWILAHLGHASTKIVILPAPGRRGVEAGYDKKGQAGCGVKLPAGQLTSGKRFAKFSV